MERTRVVSDDEDEEVDDEIPGAIIKGAIMGDDKEKFISSIHTPGLLHSRSSMYDTASELLLLICDYDAVNCATSMLDGELAPVIPRIDAYARLVPRVMELFLSRGARIDTISYDPNSVHNGFLPLEIALDVARWYLEREFVLPSTFQLIASLCLPRMADEVQDDEVEKDVALRLVEAGCRLKDGDFDFNIRDWMNSGDSSRSPIQYLGAGVPFVPPHLPVLPEWNFPSMNGIIPGNGYGSSRPTYPSKRTHGHVPKFNFRSYYSNSSDVPVKNRMKTMEQGLPKYLSGEKLPYISILIKKGKRSV